MPVIHDGHPSPKKWGKIPVLVEWKVVNGNENENDYKVIKIKNRGKLANDEI